MPPSSSSSLWRRLFGRRPEGPKHSVVLYKSRTCPLCDEALELLEQERVRRPFGLEIVDIASDPELQRLYGIEVPVVHVDGIKRFFGRVDPVLFRRLIDR
jgi:glutaredoxin